jgi:hypothetical protein
MLERLTEHVVCHRSAQSEAGCEIVWWITVYVHAFTEPSSFCLLVAPVLVLHMRDRLTGSYGQPSSHFYRGLVRTAFIIGTRVNKLKFSQSKDVDDDKGPSGREYTTSKPVYPRTLGQGDTQRPYATQSVIRGSVPQFKTGGLCFSRKEGSL